MFLKTCVSGFNCTRIYICQVFVHFGYDTALVFFMYNNNEPNMYNNDEPMLPFLYYYYYYYYHHKLLYYFYNYIIITNYLESSPESSSDYYHHDNHHHHHHHHGNQNQKKKKFPVFSTISSHLSLFYCIFALFLEYLWVIIESCH